MGVSPTTSPPLAGLTPHPDGPVPATPAAAMAVVALRTLLLVAVAIAGILVLLPAALGAVATGPLLAV